jgi:hypothetical protein
MIREEEIRRKMRIRENAYSVFLVPDNHGCRLTNQKPGN